ncbi:MAG TPA: hypothetical protein VK308_04950 [Pyrinomonadaceae bacterium]|nr:hypothetical protein [Pyrinomonadaceae bacterium]
MSEAPRATPDTIALPSPSKVASSVSFVLYRAIPKELLSVVPETMILPSDARATALANSVEESKKIIKGNLKLFWST